VAVARVWFTDKGSDIVMTALNQACHSYMSIVHDSEEKLRQIWSVIRREIAYTPLEAVAWTDNPYNLVAIFRRGHLAIKAVEQFKSQDVLL
jgi:hypothetical protein